MAAGNTNYTRGDMEVSAQKDTFGGFMAGTVYGGAAIALIVIFPTLVFAVNMGWGGALLITTILGIILGVALKLKGGWYAGVIGGAILTAILWTAFSALIALF